MSRKSGFRCEVIGLFLFFVLSSAAIADVPTRGLELWLKADAGITLNGSNVSVWADQSGKGVDASQTVSASQPALKVNAINGLPAVNFDGVDDFMTFALPINGLTGMTICLVSAATQDVEPPWPHCQNAAIFWNESASWGTAHVTPLQRAIWIRFGTGQTQTLPVKFDWGVPKVSEFTIVTAIMDGVKDYLYVDTELVLENTKPQGKIANQRDTGNLGRGYNDDTYFPGMIAEVLVYSETLSDSERQQMERYLHSKYMEQTTAVSPASKLVRCWANIKAKSDY